MRKHFSLLILFFLLLEPNLSMADSQSEEALIAHFQNVMRAPGTVTFSPPSHWGLAAPDPTKPTIRFTAVREQGLSYPAMIYLGIHPYNGTLKNYLHTIETMEKAQGGTWKDLGSINTSLGKASFSQVDYKTHFGEMRHLLVLKVENGEAYLLTAAAKKEDHPKLYEEIFNSLKTLRRNPDPIPTTK